MFEFDLSSLGIEGFLRRQPFNQTGVFQNDLPGRSSELSYSTILKRFVPLFLGFLRIADRHRAGMMLAMIPMLAKSKIFLEIHFRHR